jgi:hypothetical protein
VIGSGAALAHNSAPWELIRGRHSTTLKLGIHWGFTLRHRSDEGRSFRSPSNGGERWWWLATDRRFSQDLTTSRTTCSASPMMGTAPTGAVDLREAPGTVGLARAATPVRW